MKKLLVILVFCFGQWAFAAHEMATVVVNGMVCDFCAQGVKKQFKKVAAVSDIEVDMEAKNDKGEEEKHVILHLKHGKKLDDKTIKQKIEDAGYKVVEIRRSTKG